MRLISAALLAIVVGLLIAADVAAEPSRPPLVADGEAFDDAEALIEAIARRAPVLSVAFSPDGALLASGYYDNSVRLWDVASGRETARLEGHGAAVWSVAFSPDGALLASGSDDSSVRLWDVASGRETARFEGHGATVRSVAFNPDGALLASGYDDSSVRLWDVASGRETARLEGHAATVWSVAFSPDGALLASGSFDNSVRLWDVGSGRETARLEGHGDWVLSVAFSPDGALLASGSADNSVRLWDVASGRETARLERHGDWVRSVAFSPNGALLASGSDDNSVRLWDVASGRETVRPEGHGAGVSSVAFSPDSALLASGSFDNSVRLWDVASGRETARLERHGAAVWSVAFNPDSALLASGSDDNSVRLWDVASAEPKAIMVGGQRGTWIACGSAGRCLRFDDGTLLMRSAGTGPLESWPPKDVGREAAIEVRQDLRQIRTSDGEVAPIPITVRNAGSEAALWLNLVASVDRKGERGDRIVVHRPETIVRLGPGEQRTLEAEVSGFAAYRSPNPYGVRLNLFLTRAYGDPIALDPIEVLVGVPVPVPSEAATETSGSQARSLGVTLTNDGDAEIEQASVRAWLTPDDGKTEVPLGNFSQDDGEAVKPGEAWPVSFALPEDIAIGDAAMLRLEVTENRHPLHTWPFQVKVVPPATPWQWYLAAAIVVLATLTFAYYQRTYRHPLLVRISERPDSLIGLDIDQLAQAKRLLERTRRLGSVISTTEISRGWLDDAIDLAGSDDSQRLSKLLASRLQAQHDGPIDEGSGTGITTYRLTLPDAFILGIEACLLAFPDKSLAAPDIAAAMRALREGNSLITLVILLDADQRRQLLRQSRDETAMLVVPGGGDLTRLLLSPEPQDAFARLIASQVKVTRISPYQTRGGVMRESIFFGRHQLLADVLGREPANYLLVGGRQLGKSSFLKALERRARDRGELDCRYLSVGDRAIDAALAEALELERGSDWEAITTSLGAMPGGKPRLILVDEADLFVSGEAETGYQTLHRFRNLSEEGRCYFILAGFWRLFESVSLDYQSPIKNFGETLTIGALEPEACRDLITKPMAALNVSYESEALVERIATETGGRANLIAITCSAMLRRLDPADRTIRAEDVSRALGSAGISDALGGWQRLASDETASRLDRIIIYATAETKSFTLAELLARLRALDLEPESEALRESLLRLELAFVIGRDGQAYSFKVPLFRQMVQDEADLLEQEVRAFKRAG